MTIDLGQVARDLSLPLPKIQSTVELLDAGNTVPFITRYRKDWTGGLDEEQIRHIEDKVGKLRALAERKATILNSIESQGKLTPELAEQIQAAQSTKRLEDLYLPYKPKKRTLATIARERGLEPFADEIYEAREMPEGLAARAAYFVRVDKGLQNVEEVIQGVGHILAEQFSERADLRSRLRKILWRSGSLVSNSIAAKSEPSESDEGATLDAATAEKSEITQPSTESSVSNATANADHAKATRESESKTSSDVTPVTLDHSSSEQESDPTATAPASDSSSANAEVSVATTNRVVVTPPASSDEREKTSTDSEDQADAQSPEQNAETPATETATAVAATKPSPPLAKRVPKKDKKKKKAEDAFKDYYDFREAVTNIPPHRTLAINRGERSKVLRVRIDADAEAIDHAAEKLLVPPEHPHAEFLRLCVRDALSRLVLPALEREIRRELTEHAETHAVEVFARNLRNLLLQPPVRGRRVLAIDPGFRSGCKITALDEFGNPLAHDVIHIIGKEERLKQSRSKLVDCIKQHRSSVIAIGNGTACRETEQLVSDVIANELAGHDVAYVIVNEAGASVYSTSTLGREELPQYDATIRGAVSIGRRLLDPLSELVKINAANIGVGLYQHDVKAKHLSDSLDAVVESCVNYVGVDVNTASPALLRYVSGLNQLTARRLYEHRQEHGPFRTREQFKEVSGFGEATFVQAAGFLKINSGDNPLDATWIHPESYDTAKKVLEKIGASVSDLAARITPTKQPAAAVNPSAVAENAEATAGDKVDTDGQSEAASATSMVESVGESGEVVSSQESDATVGGATDCETRIPATSTNGSVQSGASRRLAELIAAVDEDKMAEQLDIGKLLLHDMLSAISRPGRDPRDDLPPPVFRRGIMKLEDLKPGMELTGTVLNVVDFGAFVDIGLTDSGLVHISRLADRFIRDPHEVVSVGEHLKVWVLEVDKTRRRVSLTAIEPGTEKPQPARRERFSRDGKPPASGRQSERPAARSRTPQGRQADRSRSGKRGKPPRQVAARRPKPKPKPVTPITKEMEDGREPMRSFSDLKQFFQKKRDTSKDEPSAEGE